METKIVNQRKWKDISSKLEEIEDTIDDGVTGNHSEVEQEKDSLTRAWTWEVSEAYENVRDVLLKVAYRGKEPETALESVEDDLETVVEGFEHVRDMIPEYNNLAEIYSLPGYDTVSNDIPEGVETLDPEEIGRNFHPTLGELREYYDRLVSIQESEEEKRLDWSKY